MIRTVAVVLLAAAVPLGGKAHRKSEEGNRAYADQRYEDALRAYTEAQVAAPDSPVLHYDIGNVLYRQGDFGGAGEAYRRALLSAPEGLDGSAAYNLGNAHFRNQAFDEAIKAYRRSLETDPDDVDAKRNLELALRALQQQQQQQQQQDPQDQQQEQDQQEQQEQPRQEQNQEEQPPRPQPQPEEGGMSREEAERLLANLDDQEREAQEREAEQRRGADPQRERDW